MEELDALFADGEALTKEQFNEKLAASGMNLADLSKGGYVSKEKFDRLNEGVTAQKAQVQQEAEKYKDYDSIKTENEKLKAQLQDIANKDAISKAQIEPVFADFVLYSVKQAVTDKKDFGTALGEFIEENPQYLKAGTAKPVVKVSSGVDLAHGEGAKDLSKMSMDEYYKYRIQK